MSRFRSRWPYGPEVTSFVTAAGADLMHKARAKLGLSQSEFAERLGVGTRTAQRWERPHEFPYKHGGDLLRVFPEILGLDFHTWRKDAIERAEAKLATNDAPTPLPPDIDTRPAPSSDGTPESRIRRSVLAQLYGKPSSKEEASALASELIEQAAILLRQESTV